MYTKRPNFNNFGRFFMSKNKKIRVHPKLKKPGDEPGGKSSVSCPLKPSDSAPLC